MTPEIDRPDISPRDVPRPPREPLAGLAQAKIIQAAGALFANHGVSNVTLEMVAESLKRPLASVVSSFPTIESLLIACLSYVDVGVAEGAYGQEQVRGWAGVDLFMSNADGGHFSSGLFAMYSDAVVLATDPAHPANDWLTAHTQLVRHLVVTAIETGIEDGDVLPGTNPESVYQIVTTFLHGLIPASRVVGQPFDAADVFRHFRGMLLARFATDEYLDSAGQVRG